MVTGIFFFSNNAKMKINLRNRQNTVFVLIKHLIGRFFERLKIGSKKNLSLLQEFLFARVPFTFSIALVDATKIF